MPTDDQLSARMGRMVTPLRQRDDYLSDAVRILFIADVEEGSRRRIGHGLGTDEPALILLRYLGD
jgi:hypothetical protein